MNITYLDDTTVIVFVLSRWFFLRANRPLERTLLSGGTVEGAAGSGIGIGDVGRVEPDGFDAEFERAGEVDALIVEEDDVVRVAEVTEG